MNTPPIMFFGWGVIAGMLLMSLLSGLAYAFAIRKGIITRNPYDPRQKNQ